MEKLPSVVRKHVAGGDSLHRMIEALTLDVLPTERRNAAALMGDLENLDDPNKKLVMRILVKALLHDSEASVREAVAHSIGVFGCFHGEQAAVAMPFLTKAMQVDPNGDVRMEASKTLVRFAEAGHLSDRMASFTRRLSKLADSTQQHASSEVHTRRDSVQSCASEVLNQLQSETFPTVNVVSLPDSSQLATLEGHLWKKKSISTPLKRWSRRLFLVGDGKLMWYKKGSDKREKTRGKDIDFALNPRSVKYVEGSATQFFLHPHFGEWIFDGVGGVRGGRNQDAAILLDAANSEHTRQAWRKALEVHIKYSL